MSKYSHEVSSDKLIKSEIFSLSYTKKVGSLIHLGQVKLIISISFPSVPTLTRGGRTTTN